MSLYEDLALAYDELFPPNPAARDYILGIYPGKGGVLDLGCATASLLLDLAKAGLPASGLEPSQAMLNVAARRFAESGLAPARQARLAKGGMLDAASRFPRASQGLVLCLGNTLPHLSGPGELDAFLGIAKYLLAPGSSLVLQLLNYRLVKEKLAAGAYEFPKLSGGGLSFSRSYRSRDDGALDFLTRITSASGEIQEDRTRLYPFTLEDLEEGLRKAGLGKPQLQSSWAGKPGDFREERDPYLIVRTGLA